MAEIDSLGTSYYYSGIQNSTNEALKNKKAEKSSETKKSRFSELLKTKEEPEADFETKGLPPEIAAMSFDDAVIYLKDAVDNAGNALSESVTSENIDSFKKSVSQFISFVIANNYEINSRKPRRPQFVSPVNYFANYNTKPRLKDPKVQIEVINKKLDELARETMSQQMNNLKILAQVDEIKGLIIDLMSS